MSAKTDVALGKIERYFEDNSKIQKLTGLGLNLQEAVAIVIDMKATAKPRLRSEYMARTNSYLIHDLSDNKVYYLPADHVPDWLRDGMAVLSITESETEVPGIGFKYAPGIFYVDIKAHVPLEHRIAFDAKAKQD